MKLFIADIKKIIKSPEELLAFKSELNGYDKTRFDSFSNQVRALQFLASRKIIKQNICPDYKTLKSGKITLKNGFVSVAHSKNFVVVAADDDPVGVDIEEISNKKDFQKIATRMKFKNCNTHYDFFKSWTAFEADFKRGVSPQKSKHTYIEYQGFLICLSSNKFKDIEIKHASS